MKRILAVGVLAATVAATAQGQNSGLMAAGSNFTGPGGGGGGATATVGSFLPTATAAVTIGGLPNGSSVAAFFNATVPANVTVGSGNNSVTVVVSVDAQRSAAGAVSSSANVSAFVSSLTGVPAAQAQALGNALAQIGQAAGRNTYGTTGGRLFSAVNNAIQAYNNAVNALPAGAPVPQSLIAARAILAGYTLR